MRIIWIVLLWDFWPRMHFSRKAGVQGLTNQTGDALVEKYKMPFPYAEMSSKRQQCSHWGKIMYYYIILPQWDCWMFASGARLHLGFSSRRKRSAVSGIGVRLQMSFFGQAHISGLWGILKPVMRGVIFPQTQKYFLKVLGLFSPGVVHY